MYQHQSGRTGRLWKLIRTIANIKFKMACMRNDGKATTAEYHALRKKKKEAEAALDELRRYL